MIENRRKSPKLSYSGLFLQILETKRRPSYAKDDFEAVFFLDDTRNGGTRNEDTRNMGSRYGIRGMGFEERGFLVSDTRYGIWGMWVRGMGYKEHGFEERGYDLQYTRYGKWNRRCDIHYRVCYRQCIYTYYSITILHGIAKNSEKLLELNWRIFWHTSGVQLKVHKIEIFFGFDFEICIISLLVMSKS